MKRLLEPLALLIVLLPLASCGPDARYCSSCETVVSQIGSDERARLIRGRCKVNEHEIDCTREHSYCPECRDKK